MAQPVVSVYAVAAGQPVRGGHWASGRLQGAVALLSTQPAGALESLADSQAPTWPAQAQIQALSVTSTSYTAQATLSAVDNVGVTGYRLRINGGSWTAWQAAAVFPVTGRTPSSTDALELQARDAAGNVSSSLPGSVTLSAAPPTSGDWVTRSTLPGTVWAHRFARDEEVTAHLAGTQGIDTGVLPRRHVDAAGQGWLEQIVIGARLAAPYAAGATTMQLDSAEGWPDPAVTGPFHFQACRQIGSGAATSFGDKNLFLCTARSGTTLTVQRVASPNSAFVAGAQSYAAGDLVGNESNVQWIRTFAALPAGENGLLTDDPADGGAVPLRSRLAGNALSVPRDLSMWQYGWYGHPDNQATWADWTPWQGGVSRTPRGVSQGAAPRFRLWDGQEFWLQFTVVHDPTFWNHHELFNDDGSADFWGRKTWAVQSEVSSLNQLVTGIRPCNRFDVPTVQENPFSLATYKAQRVIGSNDYARAAPSHQKGSGWDVGPHFARLTSSYLPGSGLPTPDGAAAWKFRAGRRLTFLLRVRPGRSGVAETQITVKVADRDAPGFDGTYRTLLDVSDARIVYSGSGDYDYPDGAFNQAMVTTMDALPGFQSFWLFGYLNTFQSAGLPPPRRSYWIRMTEVVFNRAQEIPAPAPDALPVWVTSIQPGQLATYAGGGAVVANNFRDVVSPLYDPFHSVKIVNDYSGAVPNPWYGAWGGKVFMGGGHSATNDNSVMVLEYGALTMTWRRLVDPSPWAYPGLGLPRDQSSAYADQMDYAWGEYLVDGKPMSLHSYGLLAVQDPASGGAANGTVWLPAILAGNYGSHKAQAGHRLPISSTSAQPVWARAGAPTFAISGDPVGLAAYVPAQRRTYLTYHNDNSAVRWLDAVTETYAVGTGAGFNVGQFGVAGGDCYAMLLAVPERDLLLLVGRVSATGNLSIQWMDVRSTVLQPTLGGTAVLSQALPLQAPWSTATWCPASSRLLIAGAQGDLGAVYEVSIPARPGSQTWTVTRAPMGAGQTIDNAEAGSVANIWGKWSYDAKIRAVVFVPLVTRQGFGNDQIRVYRPRSW